MSDREPARLEAEFRDLRDERDAYAEQISALRDALSLPLMFHAGGPWTEAQRKEWTRIAGVDEATTKVMCDTIRRVLAAYSF